MHIAMVGLPGYTWGLQPTWGYHRGPALSYHAHASMPLRDRVRPQGPTAQRLLFTSCDYVKQNTYYCVDV
eukprot:6782518-Pyramimonas_sp.AAC.1